MNLSITVRLGRKDGDLMLMASQYRISDMLILAVHYHLGLTTERIPLPPNVPFKPIKCTTIYLDDDNEDVIEFMKQYPDGYRSTAVKMLLRHATEYCDLRHLTGDAQFEAQTKAAPPKPQYIIPAKQRLEQQDAWESPKPPEFPEPPERLEPPAKPAAQPANTGFEEDDEDSIFDLI